MFQSVVLLPSLCPLLLMKTLQSQMCVSQSRPTVLLQICLHPINYSFHLFESVVHIRPCWRRCCTSSFALFAFEKSLTWWCSAGAACSFIFFILVQSFHTSCIVVLQGNFVFLFFNKCVCMCPVSVSGWTGQPQTVCLFHKGDQILAINDLHVGSVDDFNTYLSKSLKNEVNLPTVLHCATLSEYLWSNSRMISLLRWGSPSCVSLDVLTCTSPTLPALTVKDKTLPPTIESGCVLTPIYTCWVCTAVNDT